MATAPNVIAKKEGVDEYALFVEMVQYRKRHGSDEVVLASHFRIMVFRDRVYSYSREHGKKAARWQTSSRSDAATALGTATSRLRALATNTERHHVEMRGEPLLLQVRPSDIEQYELGHVPDIRYAGMSAIDAAYGKLTDEIKPSAPVKWGK